MERAPFRRLISLTSLATATAELEQAVAEDESTLGPKHPDTLTARGAPTGAAPSHREMIRVKYEVANIGLAR